MEEKLQKEPIDLREKEKVYLSNQELHDLTVFSLKSQIHKKDIELIQSKIDLAKSNEKLFQTAAVNSKKDVMLLEIRLEQKNQEHDRFRDESNKLLENITVKYEPLIHNKWGYDPKTGEIVSNE